MRNRQTGITLIGFIIVLAIVAFFGYIGMRLFPIYSEYYSAVSDLKKVAQQAGASQLTLGQVREQVDKYFYISYVQNVNPKTDITIIEDGNGRSVNLAYEVRKPLIYNLEVVAMFDHTEPLGGAQKVD